MLVGITGVTLAALGVAIAWPMSALFVGYDAALAAMTARGLALSALSFLFCGIGIFGSAFFTALGNGGVSALLSFCRTMIFQVGAILLLCALLALDGIWFSIVAAELVALILTICFVIKYRSRYHYL